MIDKIITIVTIASSLILGILVLPISISLWSAKFFIETMKEMNDFCKESSNG